MIPRKQLSLLLFVLLSISYASCANSSRTRTNSYRIAVIPKGTTHQFWKSIHAGAIKAAQEFTKQGIHVEIIWKGPLREDDREQQIAVVEGFISQNVDGIVLAPLDNMALARPVEEAKRAGIPTVIIDSGLESDAIISFIATDNIKGGELAANQMGKLMKGKGNVLLLRTQEGSSSTLDREAGFLKTIKENYPAINIIQSEQYAGSTRETAKRSSESQLTRHGGEVDGIFTSAEPTTAGMLLALQDFKKAGKVILIGFDSDRTFVEAMGHQEMQAFVVQHPFKMGYLGVKTMIAQLQGGAVEQRVDTGVYLITPENVNSSEMQELLYPPIDKFLKELGSHSEDKVGAR